MFKISNHTFTVFQQQAEQQFCKRLQESLANRYPHLLPRYPEQIQLQIVNNMIERAQSWGITWKSAIVNFAELMITIAPNFDQQADIKTVLASDRELVNQRMKTLNQYVPEQAWKQAEAAYESLPLFMQSPIYSPP